MIAFDLRRSSVKMLPIDNDAAEILYLYRLANPADRKRMERLVAAAVRGLLPPSLGALRDEGDLDRFLDSLPKAN